MSTAPPKKEGKKKEEAKKEKKPKAEAEETKKEKKPKGEGKKGKKEQKDDAKPETKGAKQPPQAQKKGHAIVKAVLSGDSLVLMGSVPNGQIAPERQVTLTGIVAPKFARGRNGTDEPFAWHSREFLRKRVIGQKVQFEVKYTHETSQREYCSIKKLEDSGEVNLSELMVKSGWARVKPPSEKQEGKERPSSERSELLRFETEAMTNKLGLHSVAPSADPNHVNPEHVRTVDWSPDARALFQKYKNVPLPAIVDNVRDGSTLRCELLGLDEFDLHHTMITLHLAGIQCPRTPLPEDVRKQLEKKKGAEKEAAGGSDKDEPRSPQSGREREQRTDTLEEPEPFALEAQQFTAARLLHRDVQVLIQGVDKFNNFFGTVLFPKGNITLKLLEHGLAQLLPWSAAITPDAQRLKDAERAAKASRQRLWSKFDPSELAAADEKSVRREVWGKVVQVPSGDTLVVHTDEGETKKLFLASIRCPRVGGGRESSEVFGLEAREYVRKRLIGQRVQIFVEYVKSATPPEAKEKSKKGKGAKGKEKEKGGKGKGKEEAAAEEEAEVKEPEQGVADREYVSIHDGKGSLAMSLLLSGFAKVIKHRLEEERSMFYEDYQKAEEQAIREGNGIFTTNLATHTPPRILDLTQPASRRDQERDQRERWARRVAGEGGDDGGKDRNKRGGKKTSVDKLHLELFKRERFHNAVVEHVFSPSRFKVFETKNNAIFFFALAGVASSKNDPPHIAELATEIVRQLVLHHNVTITVDSLDKADNFLGSMHVGKENLAVKLLADGLVKLNPRVDAAEELVKAQQSAKERKVGLWENYVESADPDNKEDDDIKVGEVLNIKITDIFDGRTFYFQNVNDPSVEDVEGKMRTFDGEAAPSVEQPQRGNVCAGLFHSDNAWHRVRIVGRAGAQFRVQFIDYGNHDVLDASNLRQLSPELAQIRPCAREALLAGVRAHRPGPGTEHENGNTALRQLNDLVWGHPLTARVELASKGKLYVTVMDANGVNLNHQLVEQGYLRYQTKPPTGLEEYVKELEPLQKSAKTSRFGMWRDGDVDSDSEEEEESATRGRGGRGKASQNGTQGRKQQQTR